MVPFQLLPACASERISTDRFIYMFFGFYRSYEELPSSPPEDGIYPQDGNHRLDFMQHHHLGHDPRTNSVVRDVSSRWEVVSWYLWSSLAICNSLLFSEACMRSSPMLDTNSWRLREMGPRRTRHTPQNQARYFRTQTCYFAVSKILK